MKNITMVTVASDHEGACLTDHVSAQADNALVFDFAEAQAIRLLAQAGLVPNCDHLPISA